MLQSFEDFLTIMESNKFYDRLLERFIQFVNANRYNIVEQVHSVAQIIKKGVILDIYERKLCCYE